jgi:hypothetical protein
MSQPTSLMHVVTKQRRLVVLAVVLATLVILSAGGMGRWQVGILAAAGIALGLANGLFTELTLLRAVESGELPNKRQYAMTSVARLLALSLVAVVLTVAFWPNGAATLFGLAFFHLITVVLTGIPVLKELHKA